MKFYNLIILMIVSNHSKYNGKIQGRYIYHVIFVYLSGAALTGRILKPSKPWPDQVLGVNSVLMC